MNEKEKAGPVLPNHENTMPVLIPMPIETKGKGFFKSLWIWWRSTRNWEFESDWNFLLPRHWGDYRNSKRICF